MATLTVFAPSRFTAGQTFGSIAGQELELLTCAPSTRNGAPSTISAVRPLRVTISGIGSAVSAVAATTSIKHAYMKCRFLITRCPHKFCEGG